MITFITSAKIQDLDQAVAEELIEYYTERYLTLCDKIQYLNQY